MSENVEVSTSRNPKGLHGLYKDNFTFTFTMSDLLPFVLRDKSLDGFSRLTEQSTPTHSAGYLMSPLSVIDVTTEQSGTFKVRQKVTRS
jgi:hypothetical protein